MGLHHSAPRACAHSFSGDGDRAGVRRRQPYRLGGDRKADTLSEALGWVKGDAGFGAGTRASLGGKKNLAFSELNLKTWRAACSIDRCKDKKATLETEVWGSQRTMGQ